MAYTPCTAALLARIRAAQGRELHPARHLWAVPPANAESVGGEISDCPDQARP